MPSKFPRFKDGDALTPRVLNTIFAELDRWRQLTASGMISVDNADGGSSPPRIVDQRQSTWVPASLTGTLATGTVGSPSNAPATLMGLASSPDASLTASGDTITVYNTFALSTSLASGTQIWVVSFAGFWYLGQASCP